MTFGQRIHKLYMLDLYVPRWDWQEDPFRLPHMYGVPAQVADEVEKHLPNWQN